MNQRNRQRSPARSERGPVPSAVRVLPPDGVPGARTSSAGTSRSSAHHEPVVLRPQDFQQLLDAVHRLRAGQAILLEMDGFASSAERRQGFAFVSGAAYALDITVAPSESRDVFLLDPTAMADAGIDNSDAGADVASRPPREMTVPNVVSTAGTCVLCDLRPADREFEPPLEMVVRRDGSRIWSPPAEVCSFCRETIRHWKFALAWCSECERWGRRSVVSPCGHLYG
jgi:hypothetical protein